MLRIILSVFVLVIFITDGNAQTDAAADNTLWATVKLRVLSDDKNTIDITPIARFHESYSDYRNWSVDYSYTRKLSPIISVGVLGRTWFLKEGKNGSFGKNRQFVWPYLIVKKKSGKATFATRFMKHWALDLDGVADRDFFRIKPSISYPLGDKMTTQLAIEPWYQFDDVDEFARFRVELALGYKITDQFSAGIVYRREEDKISPEFDMIVATITYKL